MNILSKFQQNPVITGEVTPFWNKFCAINQKFKPTGWKSSHSTTVTQI